MKLLKALPRNVGNARLFPGASKLGRLSENTLNEVIKPLHESDAVPSDVPGRPAVVHGMRSTFRNWASSELTSGPSCWSLRWPTRLATRSSALTPATTASNSAERSWPLGLRSCRIPTSLARRLASVETPALGRLRQQLARVLE